MESNVKKLSEVFVQFFEGWIKLTMGLRCWRNGARKKFSETIKNLMWNRGGRFEVYERNKDRFALVRICY